MLLTLETRVDVQVGADLFRLLSAAKEGETTAQ
jgi:hypothetical protein